MPLTLGAQALRLDAAGTLIWGRSASVFLCGSPPSEGGASTPSRREASAASGGDGVGIDLLREMTNPGVTNAPIAKTPYLSERAVEKHSNAVFAKLGLGSEEQTCRRVARVVLLFRNASVGRQEPIGQILLGLIVLPLPQYGAARQGRQVAGQHGRDHGQQRQGQGGGQPPHRRPLRGAMRLIRR